ncbi:unnamed protein product [Mytilus edulis]|uniref:Uncharacterized protein n=1 Tax=Mytilus edulis TaxID=6550 RepID=A0A8S3TUU4_MYTED|nr:unnamed protein product [Mytilus edulis]
MQDAEAVDSRERKMTEKGLLYNLELKQKERTKLLKSLNGVCDELEQLTSETKDTDAVKQVYTTWVSLYEQLLVSHEQFQKLLEVDHDRELDDARFQERNKNFIILNDNVQQWFISNQVPKIVVTTAQEDSMSRISRGSRRSRTSSSASSQLSTAKLKEEQRKAELIARANSLADKKELEEAKLQLRMREEELEIKTEMQVSEAKVKVIEALEKSMREDQELEESLIKDEIVTLLQFTIGEPHRIASGFSHLDAKKGYEAALEEFNDRYGDPDVIAHAYVKRALDWSVIKPDNAKALDDFSIFLRECLYAVENVEAARILEYSENLKHLVKKLPYYLHEKWRNIVYDTKGRKETVKFQQLVNFVKKEAKKAIDPIYGKEVLSGTNLSGKKADSSPKASGKTFVRKNFATGIKESTNEQTTQRGNIRVAFVTPCLFCQGTNHSLDNCKTFVKKDLKERFNFLKIKGLCFACLKSGHQKAVCQHKATCANCHRTHPTILHINPRQIDQPKNEESNKSVFEETTNTLSINASTHTRAGESRCQALPIVPVRLKLINCDKYVETYAFLDSGSTASFCTENVVRFLNVEGKRTQINLLTMGQEKVVDSSVISGLEVCDINGNNAISLPPIFTRPNLPVSRKDIVSSNDLQNWPHLCDVPLNRVNCDVGLLIGINVPRAMEPWDVITSVNNSPFAMKTLLGWVINGPLDVVNTDQVVGMFVSSNRITANQIFPSLEDQLRNHFKYDFSERTIDDENEPSKEDKQFLDIVSKSSSLVNGHYVIDLPFKSKDVQMPNNRKQAEQRLIALSKRFTQDHDFHKQYVTFMDKVINEGYAIRVPEKDNGQNDDDCLKSVSSTNKAIALISNIQNLLKQGGFRIAKWISNDRDVINSVSVEERAKEIKDLDLDQDSLPIDRALGVQWCVDSDKFHFNIDVKDKPATRRGILSMTSSVFDPLGFLAPFCLVGKSILQELCRLGIGWDDAIPQVLSEKWTQWLCDLVKLSEFKVN